MTTMSAFEDATGLRPHFFQLSARGRVLGHPRAGAVHETVALPRLWRGGDDRLRSLRFGVAAVSLSLAE